MRIKFIQEFFVTVEKDWYLPEVLSGEGTLEDQIVQHETERAVADGAYFVKAKRGSLTAEVVEDLPLPSMAHEDSCIHCLSKTCAGDCAESEAVPEQEER